MGRGYRGAERALERGLASVGALLVQYVAFWAVALALPNAPAPPATVPAAYSSSQLEELLAPIALYPDALLAQVLSAATTPQQVLDAGNWLLKNQTLEPVERSVVSRTLGFGRSTRALLQFPTVVDMMCSQIEWTRQLGAATRASQEDVLEAVQRLRRQALAAGSLTSGLHHRVLSYTDRGATIVTVQPVTSFVYVPMYDPRTVYTRSTSLDEETSSGDPGVPVMTRFMVFASGTRIADAFEREDAQYLVVADFGAYYGRGLHARQPYQPAYGQRLERADSYSRPARYRYAYDGRKLRIQNSDYFRRFARNANLRRFAS